MHRIDAVLQGYDWGSTDDIPAFLGLEAPGTPVAEAWWGAHASAPSPCLDARGVTLDQVIEADQAGSLGEQVASEWRGRLPYLLKILAIEKPLSIQVHPTLEQAARGFEREDLDGIPIEAPYRTYKDLSHKPEMIVALTPVVVLVGFRPADALAADLLTCHHPLARDLVANLALAESDGAGIGHYVRTVLTDSEASGLLEALAEAAKEPDASESVLVAAAALRHFPGDPGALVALALNVVHLAPGEASYTGAGIVHSYQSGVGLEIMANSDNVLRAGLTPKYIDVNALLEVAVTDPTEPIQPVARPENGRLSFDTPSREFALSIVESSASSYGIGPRIVLAVDGTCVVSKSGDGDLLTLTQGQAAFVPASDGVVRVSSDGRAAVVEVGVTP